MADHFLHGVEVVEIDNGPRPIRTVRSSVIGLVGTAPDADEQRFPLNTPVLIAALAGSRRAWTLAVAHDQLANAAFGGHEDETLSSRAGKAAREGKRWACVLCRLLDRLDPNHCEKSIESDEGKPIA